jgi:CII-binding regulator of phage lambda lysogenization HflD
VEREGRLPPDDDELEEDFSLEWAGVDDPAAEGTDDVLDVSDEDEVTEPHRPELEAEGDPARAAPWDEVGGDKEPASEEASSVASEPSGWGVHEEGEAELPALEPDDLEEEPPHGDPIEHEAEEVFERVRPSARMESLQDALSSIRERVQSLSTSMKVEGGPTSYARTSELSLYRQATDDRTLRELQRHSGETEELLRRMSTLMQDLSLDLRSIVDAARRAIDQTSEQAESSVELGRLLGDRIEQLDGQLGARLDMVDDGLTERLDQMDSALGTLQTGTGAAFDNIRAHLDKRLTKLEQRSGVGVLREEVGEVRTDVGDVRGDVAALRADLDAVHEAVRADLEVVHEAVTAAAGPPPVVDAGGEAHDRLEAVSDKLDRTLTTLTQLVEAEPASDDAALDEVLTTIKAETESAVAPFRADIEDLGRQLSAALEREEQLTVTLASLTEELRGLRKRIAVRATPPTIGDDQIQAIVDAVVAALPGRRAAARATQTEDEEADPPPSRRRRPARARPIRRAPEPDDMLDVDVEEVEELPDVEFPSSVLGPGDDEEEEPIRRARGSGGAKVKRPAIKGRRARSSQR